MSTIEATTRVFSALVLGTSLFAVPCLFAPAAHADGGPTPPTPAAAAPTAPQSAAAPPAGPAPVLFDVGAGTFFPLMVGAEGTLELPYRILVQADLGWMPAPYSNTIIDLLGDFGVLDAFEQALIKGAIQNSFAARVSAGWRPFPKLGLAVLGGYTVLTAGGSVTGADVVDSYLESRGSSDRFTGSASTAGVPLRATLQSFHATVDYRFLVLDDRLVLRASLGYLQCFASSTSVTATPARGVAQAKLDRLDADLQAYLNPFFTEYVKAPILGVYAAYRF